MKFGIAKYSLLAVQAAVVLLPFAMILGGCSSKRPEIKRERTYYVTAMRQLPPQPVYNRIRTAKLPEPLPPKKGAARAAPLILPVVHFQVEDLPLDQAALILSATARYHTYVAGTVADRRVTIDDLGTIDELAAAMAAQAGVYAVVDHVNHELRFLAGRGTTPELWNQGENANEY